ncbi:NO-inducible flavohemoprotein [Sutterella faecalis]|uniref:Flavohemoprotein n=2 Tax=Sutterella TaxID=40544 RepID=A0AAI9SE47_9BURK|nr:MULTISPECIES: NO-inducible flavohemoprotein [Sutterella]KAB7652927.1 NO-inducible flavohemoprotein [Sutterella seckii]MBE5691622.1 NO-inducible flavohemoprotein [Sutterella sp.]QDA54431.1 NO-inducible flavohemoprotein [Sutterella faecalis]
MLTPRQIELIKATVPVLREHGVALTSHFYKRMLNGNPELKNVFNQSHQALGRQQKALAGAVLAYAENIENPGVLIGAVKHIAAKHCTVGIRAEHYPIVGKHLLASIREVLGEAATDELIDAWAAAYGMLADLLIQVESGIYTEQSTTEGGWSGWRPFVVEKRVEETPEVASFYLRPSDGGNVPTFKPGQFVSVRAYLPELGVDQPRQYSLSHAPVCDKGLRITVKRIDAHDGAPQGRMSTHLHQTLKEGDVIELSAPAGEFFLKDGENPVVLVSAGIGITPLFAMLQSIASKTPKRPVIFVHTSRTKENFALRDAVKTQLAKLENAKAHLFLTAPKAAEAACCCNCTFEKHQGRPGAADILALNLPKDADVYVCGPTGFMASMKEAFLNAGIPAGNIHSEVFGTGAES